MRKVFWVAVGAAGGIWVYRRAQAMTEQAREQGLMLTAQQAGLSAYHAASTARAVAMTSLARAREFQTQQSSGVGPGTQELGE